MGSHLTGVDSLDSLRQVGRDRLLAKDVLTSCGASFDLVGVEARRRADPHGIDVRVVDHLIVAHE